jgi:Rrf2 family protein
MRISQKLDYACRAMVQLAKRHDGETLTRLEDLAQREAVSANFLVQILNDLKRGELIVSRRGKAGGYLLNQEPKKITLLQIVEAVEPSLLTFSTPSDGDSGAAVRAVWEKVSAQTREHLASIDLNQLGARGNEPMYYI